MGFPNARQRVKVEVAAIRPSPASTRPPAVCMVAIAPPGWPRIGLLRPEMLVRDASNSDNSGEFTACVEHLRIEAMQDLTMFPGLAQAEPSRLRDALRLCFAGGAEAVDVLIVYGTDRAPWEIDHPDVLVMFSAFLEELLGVMLLFPDAGRPILRPSRWVEDPEVGLVPRHPFHPDEPAARIQRLIRWLRQPLEQRYQIALLDGIGMPPERVLPMTGVDVALCGWRGMARDLRTHGWRCASALVAGQLARPNTSLFEGAAGHVIALPPGRAVHQDRRSELEVLPGPMHVPQQDPRHVVLSLDDRGHRVRVDGEMCCRAPVGQWTIPALRTVKALHWQIVRSSSLITFQLVNPAQTFALQVAINEAIRPFVQAGVLVGPDASGPPIVTTEMIRDPNAPGLVANISAQVRPWCRDIKIRVGLRSGGTPEIEMRT